MYVCKNFLRQVLTWINGKMTATLYNLPEDRGDLADHVVKTNIEVAKFTLGTQANYGDLFWLAHTITQEEAEGDHYDPH